MARRPHHSRNGNGNGNGNGHGFNLATIVQIGAIPLITTVIMLSGFYYLTKDQLARHEAAISSTIPEEFKEEKQAREKTRSEFLDKLGKLNDGISSLNTNVQVQATVLGQIKDQLQQSRDRR